MFERFTDRARRVVVWAQEEARLLNHDHIGTEHILLGLIRDPGVAGEVLESAGISLAAVREQVRKAVGPGKRGEGSGHIPFTPRAKRALELSLRESLQLGHDYIGPEHILLGLIREGEGVAATVLTGLGADLNRIRQRVTEVVGHHPAGEPGHATPPATRGPLEPQLEGITGRLSEIIGRLDQIGDRLTAIERYLGMGGWGGATGE